MPQIPEEYEIVRTGNRECVYLYKNGRAIGLFTTQEEAYKYIPVLKSTEEAKLVAKEREAYRQGREHKQHRF